MASQVQYRRGTNAQNIAFTGALAEITVDTTNGTLRVHDAITPGGSNIATVSYVTAQISALSANSITNGTSSVAVIASGGNIRSNIAGTTVQTISSGLVEITGGLSVTGNVQGGNLRTAGLISATGSITVGGDISLTGNIVDAAAMTISTSSNGNITLSPNGTGVIIASKDILNGQGNGVGNIGNATGYFNTVFAKATSAQYADLAEMYLADNNYTSGTVVEFGGSLEITITSKDHSTSVAGVISTNPSYLMNATLDGNNVLAVALTGRVPCRVQGPVKKGTVLVSGNVPGTAMALDKAKFEPGCVVGKSLEVINSTDVVTIEVAVGRL